MEEVEDLDELEEIVEEESAEEAKEDSYIIKNLIISKELEQWRF